jgi:hypothetical protein
VNISVREDTRIYPDLCFFFQQVSSYREDTEIFPEICLSFQQVFKFFSMKYTHHFDIFGAMYEKIYPVNPKNAYSFENSCQQNSDVDMYYGMS